MNLSKAWSLSRLSYAELVYRPLLTSGLPVKYAGTKRSVHQAIRGATLNKAIFALFTMGGAVFPFLVYKLAFEAISLSVTTALSIILGFGYLVLYSVQVLPTFVTSGSFGPLILLPLEPRERSTVALLTLWRTLDYILVLSLATECITVAYFTGSLAAAGLVLIVSLSSSILAVAVAIRLIAVFETRLENLSTGGGKGVAALRGYLRPLLFVVWGLGVMSAVFLFSVISALAPPLNLLLNHPTEPLGIVASLIFPFSTGLLVSEFLGFGLTSISVVLAAAGVCAVVLGAALAGWTTPQVIDRVVVNAGRGSVSRLAESAGQYSFRIRGRLSGYIRKDLRVASRNPATGFLFALPLFEILAVVFPVTATSVVRQSALIVGSQVGGSFALFTAFLLVTVEDMGIEKRSALPLAESVRTLSKVIVSTATYVPVPATLAVLLLVKPSTFWGGVFIPVAAIATVFAACVVEVTVLNTLAEWGRGTAVRFISGIGSGELVMVIPSFAYTLDFVATHDQSTSLLVLVVTSAIECLLSVSILKRLASRASRRGAAQ